MTFSIAARCARTGMFGVAITTSSISVGSRCPHVRAGVGAVATQNITDPHLATLVLDAMEAGSDANSAIAQITIDREFIDYRQLTAVDKDGTTAHFTGAHILGTNAISEEIDNTLEKVLKDKRMNIDGYDDSKWIVLDYGTVVVHLFDEDTRTFYSLEALWGDAEKVDISDLLKKVR